MERIIVGTPSRTAEEQLGVLLEAYNIFLERNGTRADLWAEFDTSDSWHHCVSKMRRAEASLRIMAKEVNNWGNEISPSLHKELEDSLLDLINFSVFTLRHVRAGRIA